MVLKNEIKISLDKGKLRLLVFLAFLFAIAGVWVIVQSGKMVNAARPSQTVIVIVGAAAVIFAGVCLLFIFRKFGDTNPGLIINDEGITDNSSGTAAGLVPWSAIERVDMARVKSQQFILLFVNDADARIAAQPNGMKRQLMKMNQRLYGTPVCINVNTLQCGFDEIYRLISDSFERRKELDNMQKNEADYNANSMDGSQ